MPTLFTPRQFQQVADEGFRRLKHYRAARMQYLRAYTGKYYADSKGDIGNEPINLIFNTIRAMVPHLVMKNPVNVITTDDPDQEDYAFLLGRGIDLTERRLKFDKTLRAAVVSAFFAFGLLKTGISASGQALYIDDITVDPGACYTDLVDLDNFTFDPMCTEWEEANFLGDKIRVPRQELLDAAGYAHDIVRAIPRSHGIGSDEGGTKNLSQKPNAMSHMEEAMDYVDVVELWVPKANAVVCIPDPKVLTADQYLNVREYYGPKDGPYTRLALTQPVPNNPLPIAPVGIWFDLHKKANEIFVKTMNQALRQKDVGIFDPSVIDQAEDVREAQDGEMIPGDPSKIQMLSFGGQNQKNEGMLQQLQIWYNYIAGNPDQIAGLSSNADTATQANILAGNSNVGIADSEDIVATAAAEVANKIAWYLHNDPFMELPIALRTTEGKPVKVTLTPEQRRGDFLMMNFTIKPRSMRRLPADELARRLNVFTTNIVPAAAMAAQAMMGIGQQFNIMAYLTKIADAMEILDDIEDIFIDPQWQQKLALIAQQGAKPDGNATKKPGSGSGTAGLSLPGVMQNGGAPMQTGVPTAPQQANMSAQLGANPGQQMNQQMGNL
jgi:hypothetical protein